MKYLKAPYVSILKFLKIGLFCNLFLLLIILLKENGSDPMQRTEMQQYSPTKKAPIPGSVLFNIPLNHMQFKMMINNALPYFARNVSMRNIHLLIIFTNNQEAAIFKYLSKNIFDKCNRISYIVIPKGIVEVFFYLIRRKIIRLSFLSRNGMLFIRPGKN